MELNLKRHNHQVEMVQRGYVQTPDRTGSGSVTGSDPVFCAMVIFSSIFYSLCTVGRGLQHTKLFLPHTFIPI